MALQLLKSTASSDKLRDQEPTWWTGWKPAGLRPWIHQRLNPSAQIRINRVEQDGWIDFFFGHASEATLMVHSVLEGNAKIGLHFCLEDAYDLIDQPSPSIEIPAHLWRSLQQDIKFCRS